MTFEELNRFAAMPGVEIGAHFASRAAVAQRFGDRAGNRGGTPYATRACGQHDPALALPFGLYDERIATARRLPA